MKAPETWRKTILAALLAAAVLALFWGALSCDFVNYDDPAYVTSNAQVERGLSWAGVNWALGTDAASNWHPLTWLSHMADVSVWGLKPRGHHLTSVLLHAANAVLLFLLLTYLTGAMGRSALVAALFALHPLRVESVVWISERKDVLSTFFWILTVWLYAGYAKRRSGAFYVLSLACFGLGLMSKPMLVTLPFVLMLLDYWPLHRVQKGRGLKLILEKAPFFILAAISSVITFVVQRRGGAVSANGRPAAGGTDLQRVHFLCSLPGKNILARAPIHSLSASAPVAERGGGRGRNPLDSNHGGRGPTGRAQPCLIVGWLWFLGMLVPVIGLVQVGIQSMADRYSYLSCVGVLIMVVWGAPEWLAGSAAGRRILAAAAALALAACVVLTPRQIRYWARQRNPFQTRRRGHG